MYIEECLDSIINQTLHDIEVLCVDDGSTDETTKIIEAYIKKDDRIKLIKQPHEGVSSARNKAIKLSAGKYIMFVDGDDMLYDAEVLESLYSETKKHKVAICGGNVMMFDKDWKIGRKYPSHRNPSFKEDGEVSFTDYGCPYGFTQYIYRRSIIIDNNIVFPNYSCWEDPVFMATAFSKAQRFWSLNKYVYCYRRGIHKKEHRMSDIGDLLLASIELMRIGADNDNIKLQEDTLNVLYDHRLKLLQFYEYNPSFLKEKLKEMKRLLNSIIKTKTDRAIILEEDYYLKCKIEIELDTTHLIDSCKNKSIIIYGAGDYGKRMYKLLTSYNVHVLGFAVTDFKLHDDRFLYGIPVKKAAEWINDKNTDLKSFIISVYDKDQRCLIRKYLNETNVDVIEFNLDILDEKLVL